MTSLYDLTVRFSVVSAGVSAAIAAITQQFRGVQTEAGRTQAAVQSALAQRTSSYTALQRSTNSLQMAQNRYNTALQDHLRISGQYGATSLQAGRSLDRLKQSHLSLANAQLTQTGTANALTNATAKYTASASAAEAAAARQARMDRGMGQIGAGVVMTGVGLGIWNVLGGAVKRAMGLEVIQTNIGQALTDTAGHGLSAPARAAALGKLSTAEIAIGLHNQMSQTQVAQIAQAAVNAGMTQPAVLLGQGRTPGILPQLANFAEVLMMRRGYAPDQSASIAAQFAHQFGAWKPDQFNLLTGTLGRALAISPATPEQFLQLTSQYSSVLREAYGPKRVNQTITDSITTAALLSELGQETRGGTQFAQIIARSVGMPTNRSRGQRRALMDLQRRAGTQFFDPTSGEFNGTANVISGIYRASLSEKPKQFIQQMTEVWGQVGNRIAGAIVNPSSQNRLRVLNTMLGPTGGLPTLQQMQNAANNTTQGQLNQLNGDLNTLDTIIGTQLLPSLDPFVRSLTEGAKTLVLFAQQHPTIVRLTAQFAALSGSILILLGPLTVAAGIFNILFAAGTNLAALFTSVIVPLVALAGGIAAVVTGTALLAGAVLSLYLAFKTFKQFFDQFRVGKPTTTFPDQVGHGTPPTGGDLWMNGKWYKRNTTVGSPTYGSWVPDVPGRGGAPGAGAAHDPHAGMHWVAGHGSQRGEWVRNPPRGNSQPTASKVRLLPTGGTAPMPPGWDKQPPPVPTHVTINVLGPDHATKHELATHIAGLITRTVQHDEQWGGTGVYGQDLAPGPMGV